MFVTSVFRVFTASFKSSFSAAEAVCVVNLFVTSNSLTVTFSGMVTPRMFLTFMYVFTSTVFASPSTSNLNSVGLVTLGMVKLSTTEDEMV